MALSQPATFNEEWTDERVLSYLNQLPPTGENADFNVLYTAYKHMRPLDFERLLKAFTAQGRNVNAANKQGLTLSQVIAPYHRHNSQFIALLQQYAA